MSEKERETANEPKLCRKGLASFLIILQYPYLCCRLAAAAVTPWAAAMYSNAKEDGQVEAEGKS